MLYYSAYSNDNVCIPDFALLEIKKKRKFKRTRIQSSFQFSMVGTTNLHSVVFDYVSRLFKKIQGNRRCNFVFIALKI